MFLIEVTCSYKGKTINKMNIFKKLYNIGRKLYKSVFKERRYASIIYGVAFLVGTIVWSAIGMGIPVINVAAIAIYAAWIAYESYQLYKEMKTASKVPVHVDEPNDRFV
jgi:hypothetical protein